MAQKLTCSAARGIILDQGIEPVSPALAGRFSTTLAGILVLNRALLMAQWMGCGLTLVSLEPGLSAVNLFPWVPPIHI